MGGQLVAEFDGSTGNLRKEYMSGGATLVTIEPTSINSNGTQYTTSDNLGSPRVITNSSASVAGRHDYMPFGEDLGAGTGGRTTGMGFSGGSSDSNRNKFTGYERDTETSLDFAQARYYSNAQGRFTSPDPFAGSATIGNPQTFNRYVYCGNNPVNAVDPSGLSSGAEFSMNNMDGSDMGKGHSGFNTEREDAERDYEQRLQNTRDEIAANNALAVGQDDLAREIVGNNSALQAVDANGNDATNDFLSRNPSDEVAEQQNTGQRQPDECGPYVVAVDPNSLVGKKKKGDGECVALVQNVPNGVPNTQYWRQGERVRGNIDLAPGTVIANFDGLGRWPGLQSGNHACIYLSQDRDGIWVVDQWNGPNPTKTIIKRHILFDDKRSDPNNGNRFFVVMTVMPDKR